MPERHHEVTRLEGFSDTVFGFALTLLVVSLDTPESVSDLLDQAKGFGPFALTFAMVCWIWYEHNVFFRRYGLQDPWTIFLNSVLLFVVLFFVYPLRFLAQQIVALISGGQPDFGSGAFESRWLMVMYSTGVVLIFGCFLLLYRHARRRAGPEGFTPEGRILLDYGRQAHAISMGIGLVSIAIVLVRADWSVYAGLVYCLMGPFHAWNGYRRGAALATLRAPARGRSRR
jgi:hypothetical protein